MQYGLSNSGLSKFKNSDQIQFKSASTVLKLEYSTLLLSRPSPVEKRYLLNDKNNRKRWEGITHIMVVTQTQIHRIQSRHKHTEDTKD
jgi:hypothetical protein